MSGEAPKQPVQRAGGTSVPGAPVVKDGQTLSATVAFGPELRLGVRSTHDNTPVPGLTVRAIKVEVTSGPGAGAEWSWDANDGAFQTLARSGKPPAYSDPWSAADDAELAEIEAALRAQILCFNLESVDELARVQAVAARLGVKAPVSVRTNPDVDPKTHPYITTGLKQNKFGVAYGDTLALYRRAAALPNIEIVGIDCHIGSQITEVAPYVDAAERILDLVEALSREGIELAHIDFGGGLGITYRDETPPATGALIAAVLERVRARGHAHRTVLFEPGRSIVGRAGALLTQVSFLKRGEAKNFAIVDAAMNDLMRPALYQAWMDVQPVTPGAAPSACYDVVGPVCESGDWLARDRDLAIAEGDLLAIVGAGAYGMSMASNYNSRGRAAEVMVDGGRAYEVRRRETVEDLFAGESVLP